MEETELAWAAGFFDGEGSVHGFMRLSVGQKDRRPLDRFVSAVDPDGKVYGPYRNTNGNDIYHYICQGKRAVSVLRKLWPYLSEPKREQIKSLNCIHVEKVAA